MRVLLPPTKASLIHKRAQGTLEGIPGWNTPMSAAQTRLQSNDCGPDTKATLISPTSFQLVSEIIL